MGRKDDLVHRVVVSDADHDRLLNDQKIKGEAETRRFTGEATAARYDEALDDETIPDGAEIVGKTARSLTIEADGKATVLKFGTKRECGAVGQAIEDQKQFRDPVSLSPRDEGFDEAAEAAGLDVDEELREAREFPDDVVFDDKPDDVRDFLSGR